MLSVENLEVYYGAIHAIKGVSFRVKQGQIVSLIGANGAGKTTIMHAVSGIIKSQTGSIIFDDNNITHTRAHTIVEMGMAQVPEGRRIFAKMSVKENLEMGAYSRKDKGNLEADYDMVYERFPRLKERRKQMAGTMSGGEQQMLAIARALMSKPKLLLLDEPSMGLAPILVDEVFSIIKDINQGGTTILLVEQNAHKALSIADEAYVLETGNVVLAGKAQEMLDHEEVRKAYLG